MRLPLLLFALSLSCCLPARTDSLQLTDAVSPEYYGALGTAAAERGDYGRAILAFRRGLRLAPGHAYLRNNLAFARAEAGTEVLEVRQFVLTRWWGRLAAFLGAGLALTLSVVFWTLAVAGATYWYLRRRTMDERRRFALLPLAGVALALALLFLLLGQSRNADLFEPRDGVLLETAELRVAPGTSATLEAELKPGHELTVLDERTGFVKVTLGDGRQGWVPAAAVARVFPSG